MNGAKEDETFIYFTCILSAYKITCLKMEKIVSARVELNDYTNRVLGIIKLKFGLRDKSEALNKFIELYGDEIMEKEATEDYVKRIISITKKHLEKHRNKKMTLQELDKLCRV